MRHTPSALMLYAAGFGTRMGTLTRNQPKPLVQVGGRALLDHALDLAREAGSDPIVVNVHYLADQIVDHLRGSDVVVSDETDRILETGGGLRRALPLLGPGPVMTLNTDAVWTGPNVLTSLQNNWRDTMGTLLALVPVQNATGYRGAGDFDLDADGRVRRGTSYVYTGAQIIDPAGLAAIPEEVFSTNILWNKMIAEGRVYGTLHHGGWCDVGRPESIPLAEAMLHG